MMAEQKTEKKTEQKKEQKTKKQKKPIKVPVILQMENLECGAVSLAMVLAYFGKWVPQSEVRAACGVSRDGSNAGNIVKAAKGYGLKYKAYRYTTDRLREAATFPSILFWNRNHYVVLCGFWGDYAYINDPAQGRVRMPMEEFDECYSGVCLTFEKGEDFQEGGKQPSIWSYLKGYLTGKTKIILLVMLTGALATAAETVTPVLKRVFADYILPGSAPSWFRGFVLLFAAVILFQFVSSVINTIYVKRATGKLAVTSTASFMNHLFRMPLDFFSQRSAGDLSSRAQSNDTVADTMIGQLAPVLMNLVLAVFYLVVMFRYSVALTVVGLFTVAVNLILSQAISNKRTEVSRVKSRDQSKVSSATTSAIDMIETIKASGAEEGYLERWSGYHANVTKSQVKCDGLNAVLGTVPSTIQNLSSVIIMLMAFWMIMQGHFTAGMYLAFQSCLSSFLSPVNDLIDAGQNITELRSQIEKITDVLDYQEDHVFGEPGTPEELSDAQKLSGNVEIKNVTFGYARLGDPIIKDFSLTVTPGKCVALVGSSGSGKSTVAKLLTGLYAPWSGEILYDGKKISEITKPIFTGSVAMVDQEITLFRDTIANNIRMWDKSIEDYDMILAARDAGIHDDIMHRPGGYEHMLESNGSNLSGGQRQRIEIARVLAVDPSILIMDEATSALDAETESEITKYIHDRGVTCILIAHRLSTIRDCDEILVLKDGEVVQRGTHEELIEQDGLYKQLVTTE